MTRRVFVFDPSACFGCLGCVAACAAANRTPAGLFWRQVLKVPPENGRNDTVYLSLACNHCDNAPCAAACPSNALKKDPATGAVVHDPDACLGCRYCQMACPYDAIRWDEDKRTVSKCDFCVERLGRGEEPACVATCFSGALRCETIADGPEPKALDRETLGFKTAPGTDPGIRFRRQTFLEKK